MVVLVLSQVITTLQRPQNATESNFLNKKSKTFLSRKESFSTEFENLISNFHNITIVIIKGATIRYPGVGGVWAMAGVQGKVAFGLSHFCHLAFMF